MVGVLLVSLSYPLANKIYTSKSAKHRNDLTRDQQLVVVQPTISKRFFLSIIFAPLTCIILSVNFEEQSSDSLKNKLSALTVMMFVVIIMYLIELASRFRSLRPLAVAHHLYAYLDSIVPAFFLTTANVKSSSLLVYYITNEAITFVGLIMYRLCPTHRLIRTVILAGMVVFGVLRPVQLI